MHMLLRFITIGVDRWAVLGMGSTNWPLVHQAKWTTAWYILGDHDS